MPLDSYVTLPGAGLRVSPLTLGAMGFGEDWGWGVDATTTEGILDRYVELGGNSIDTANLYTNGHSEKLIGDWLAARPGQRDRIVLGTKFFGNLHLGDPNGGGSGRKAIIRQLDESLRRLQTDYVDLYWIHNWDAGTPLEETLRTLDDLVTAGRIRYAAISDFPAWRAAQAQMLAGSKDWNPAVGLQLEYSLVERTPEAELLPMAQTLGLGGFPWSPLRGGLLARPRAEAPASSRAARPMDDRTGVIVDTVESVATRLDVSMASVALAWVRRRPGVTSTIIGARSIGQLEANLESLEVDLGDAELAELDEVSTPTLPFPWDNNRGIGGMVQYAGATVDGIAHPTYPNLARSDIRY